jgi:hypothetical protein
MSNPAPLNTLSIWQRLWVFTCRFWIMVFFRLGLYRRKSAAHRKLFDKQYEGTPLSTYRTLAELATKMGSFQWKKDGLTELWDAVCTAEKVEKVGFGNSSHGNDCDEEAIYLTTVIAKSLGLGIMKDKIQNPRFFTVMWYEPDKGSVSGHNVVLLQNITDKLENGLPIVRYSYMDYGMPSAQFDTVDEVANLIRSNYAGWDSTGHGTQPFVGLGWCIQDEALNVVQRSWS